MQHGEPDEIARSPGLKATGAAASYRGLILSCTLFKYLLPFVGEANPVSLFYKLLILIAAADESRAAQSQ